MRIFNRFDFDQIVYLKTDSDQSRRMVVSIKVDKYGLMYGLVCGVDFSWHYESEISESKDILMATNN